MVGEVVELVGNTGAGSPLQIAGIVANVGVITGTTVIVLVAVVAHCPAVGVNVYVVVPAVAVLTAGDHVPEIEGALVELTGKIGAIEF